MQQGQLLALGRLCSACNLSFDCIASRCSSLAKSDRPSRTCCANSAPSVWHLLHHSDTELRALVLDTRAGTARALAAASPGVRRTVASSGATCARRGPGSASSHAAAAVSTSTSARACAHKTAGIHLVFFLPTLHQAVLHVLVVHILVLAIKATWEQTLSATEHASSDSSARSASSRSAGSSATSSGGRLAHWEHA